MRLDLLEKLLRRSLDPGTPTAEAETSAVMFVRAARRDRVAFDVLRGLFPTGPVVRVMNVGPPRPPACELVMPFGKYRGTTLGDVGRREPGYLSWLAENARERWLSAAARIALDYLTSERP